VKNEVVIVVCGAMFGEVRVNNLVALLSRVLVDFSVGKISALVSTIRSMSIHKRRLCSLLPHQPGGLILFMDHAATQASNDGNRQNNRIT